MKNKNDCDHKNTMKAGKHISCGCIRQRLKCKDCGATIFGAILEQVN
jgi:transposase-like protein